VVERRRDTGYRSGSRDQRLRPEPERKAQYRPREPESTPRRWLDYPLCHHMLRIAGPHLPIRGTVASSPAPVPRACADRVSRCRDHGRLSNAPNWLRDAIAGAGHSFPVSRGKSFPTEVSSRVQNTSRARTVIFYHREWRLTDQGLPVAIARTTAEVPHLIVRPHSRQFC